MKGRSFTDMSAQALRSGPGKPRDLMRIALGKGKHATVLRLPMPAALQLAQMIAKCGEKAAADDEREQGGLSA